MPDVTEQVSYAEVREAHRRGDVAQIRKWRDKGQLDELLAGRDPGSPGSAPAAGPSPETDEGPARGSADQGARGLGLSLGQIKSREQLASMSRAEVLEAYASGRCDRLLGGLK